MKRGADEQREEVKEETRRAMSLCLSLWEDGMRVSTRSPLPLVNGLHVSTVYIRAKLIRGGFRNQSCPTLSFGTS
jgi:hypothetical protein